MIKHHYQKRLLAGILLIGLTLPLCGCFLPDQITSFLNEKILKKSSDNSDTVIFSIEEDDCTNGEAKVILLNYQKEYSSIYGIDVWSSQNMSGTITDTADALSSETESSDSLESYVKDLTLAQLAKVFTMDAIAADQEIELSSSETKAAKKAANVFYDGLSTDEIAYLDIPESEIAALYERYALADKVYTLLTENVDPEVSDDEARVAIVDQIYTTSKESAQEALAELDSGTDFSSVAATYSEIKESHIYVNRDTFPDNVVAQIFSLTENTCSDLIPSGDGYYIFYCESPFDPDLTEDHKADVLEQRKADALSEVYDAYCDSLSSSLYESVWDNVHVDVSLTLEGDSFLTIYYQYFSSTQNEDTQP